MGDVAVHYNICRIAVEHEVGADRRCARIANNLLRHERECRVIDRDHAITNRVGCLNRQTIRAVNGRVRGRLRSDAVPGEVAGYNGIRDVTV